MPALASARPTARPGAVLSQHRDTHRCTASHPETQPLNPKLLTINLSRTTHSTRETFSDPDQSRALQPYTLHPEPCTPNPRPKTLRPKTLILNPEP